MVRICLSTAVLVAWLAPGAQAAEVSGVILINKKIEKRNVAPAVYDLRGAAVPNKSSPEPRNEFDRIAVWLEPDNGGARASKPITATIEQRDRRFDPELLIVPVGSTVAFPNQDPIFHNIFSLSRAQSFDLGYYPKGQSRSVRFQRPGVVQVYCHVHPNMYAAVVVTDTPWFGKPGAGGTVSWKDVPPGKYRMLAWHKVAGLFRKDVTVPDAGPVSVTLSIPLDEDENGR
jgi:plastocyanin